MTVLTRDSVAAATAPSGLIVGRSDARTEVQALPRLSVVIPCYNGAETLADTLRSLQRQTFRQWEAIVVDDGSTDASREIVRRWAALDGRIRLIEAEHGGVAKAWNRGLSAARSPWLAFLDCDDWLARDAYARLLRLAEARPSAGVVVGGTRVVLPNGEQRHYPQPDLSDAFGQLCYRGGLAIHSAIVQRRLAMSVGGFIGGLVTHEDWDFWQRLARSGVEFAQTDAVVAFYRSRPGSLSRRVWQFAVDGLEVMNRGHAPDPRVRDPHPAHADGGPKEDLPMRRLYFALWSAARDIATGGDGLAIAALLDGDPQVEFEARDLGELLASGMGDMAARAPAALAPHWPEFEPKLAAVLERAAPGETAARARAVALAVVKARLNAGAAGDADVVDLDRPRVPPVLDGDPPPVFQLRARGRTLGAVALAALGPTSTARFAELVAAQSERLPLKPALDALAPWTSPAFLGAAAAQLLRPAGQASFGRDFLRMRVRAAAVAGLRAEIAARLRRAPEPEGGDRHAERLQGLRAELGDTSAAPRPASAGVSTGRARTAPAGAHSLHVPILMYHRVAAAGPLPRYRVSPGAFAQQMRELQAAGFHAIGPEDLAEALETGRPLPGRPVWLTFDDGYNDFHDEAWPVLRACGFTATVFAVAGKLGGAADWDSDYGQPASLMRPERIRELAEAGITIGSHTLTHRRLTQLSVEEVYREAIGSAARIAEVAGRRPLAFCYPYGGQDAVVEQAVEQAGYRIATSITPGVANLASAPLRLPRVEVAGGDDLASFRRKLRIADLAAV